MVGQRSPKPLMRVRFLPGLQLPMNEFSELSEADKQRPALVDQKKKALAAHFQTHPLPSETLSIFDDAEMQDTIISATAEAWQNAGMPMQKEPPESVSQTAETLFKIIGSVIVDDLPNPQTREVFGDASVMFLNSHAAQRQDPVVPFPYGAKLRSALVNLDFSVTNRGTEEHPDYLIADKNSS